MAGLCGIALGITIEIADNAKGTMRMFHVNF